VGDDPSVPGVSAIPWRSLEVSARLGMRWLSLHTGLPALVVAALVIVLGYRILKKSARFAVEVALVAALLLAATSAGWIRW
jgi:predicted membrane-bound spermidine synthase